MTLWTSSMYKSSDDLEKPGETVMASGRKARQLTGNLKVVEENKSLTPAQQRTKALAYQWASKNKQKQNYKKCGLAACKANGDLLKNV